MENNQENKNNIVFEEESASEKPEELDPIDRLYAKDELTKKDKIKNFFYYYKTAIIFSAIVVVLIGILTVQAFNKVDPDIYVLYAGDRYVKEAEVYNGLRDGLSELIGEDYNGDGRTEVQIIVKMVTPLNPDNVSASAVRQGIDEFRTEVNSGRSVICLIDKDIYNDVNKERLVSLESVLGEKPEMAIDDYGVLLSDTHFGSYNSAFEKIADDTVVCIKKEIFATDREEYLMHVDAFQNIFKNSAKESE